MTKLSLDVGYKVSEEDKRFYSENGYLVLRQVVPRDKLKKLEEIFDSFMRGEVEVPEKDFCDMSAGFDVKVEDFQLVNAMLPRKYLPTLEENIFEKISLSIARQVIGDDIGLDYDQFLGKKPNKENAKFPMHQDMAYWPRGTPDTRTATVSLALTDSFQEHGCLQVIPGTHKDKVLRSHKNAMFENNSREDSHAQAISLSVNDKVEFCPLNAGDVTIHNEWIVHGSSGNQTANWRKTYVIAYRSLATIKWEREHGFTHSHNDTVNWDNFDDILKG